MNLHERRMHMKTEPFDIDNHHNHQHNRPYRDTFTRLDRIVPGGSSESRVGGRIGMGRLELEPASHWSRCKVDAPPMSLCSAGAPQSGRKRCASASHRGYGRSRDLQ